MTSQQIVIMSYRREYVIKDRCDHYIREKNGSDLEMRVVASEEEAINYIVKRLCSDTKASFMHVIFTSWEGLVQFSKDHPPGFARVKDYYTDKWTEQQSIWVARPEVDYDSEWYEELEAADTEASAMNDRIHQAVKQKLIDSAAPTAVIKKDTIK